MATKPSLPQGTRDFGPDVVRKRNYIFSTIRSVFECYGFQPLETPAFENLDTLLGKYGDEGDKLIFKILNNGLGDPRNAEKARAAFEKVLAGKNDKDLTERALRYDLTIPFARYVAMNHGQLSFPFKRYQIQPVWRADRPQRGRYREFYQCDADVVGSRALLNEIELAHIYADVFTRLGIKAAIHINDRRILAALAKICGDGAGMTAITVAIDKLDKVGIEKVKEELMAGGLTGEQTSLVEQYLAIAGGSDNNAVLAQLRTFFGTSEDATAGLDSLEKLLEGSSTMATGCTIRIDPTLARGLNYYTGTIFEVKAPKEVAIGSIGGGGRYDDLTGLFGVTGIPGVGISFGVDRIYDVMEELKLFPNDVATGTQVLFFNLGEKESKAAFSILQQLRSRGIRGELYPENSKFDKQFKYAERKQIPFVAIIGEEELSSNSCKLKDIRSGQQQTLTTEQILEQPFN